MARTKKEIFFLVIGLLVSPFVPKGQCEKVKGEEPEHIIFPKAFFSSNADNLKRLLSNNVLIDDVTDKTRTSSSEPTLSPSSDESTTRFDVDGTTGVISSPGIPCENVTVNATSGSTHQWHQWNNSHYAIFTSDLTWEDASERCRCEGAHLVFIESDQENREVFRLAVNVSGLQNAHWWIGLNDRAEENSWKWEDEPVTYSNWKPSEPNNMNDNEHCGELISQGGDKAWWNDRPCNELCHFICEKDLKADT